MFGHDADPNSKNYRYGVLPPTVGLDLVKEQLLLAHRYRNKLVELELERRKIVYKRLTELVPQVLLLETRLAEETATVDGIATEMKKLRQKARKRAVVPKELRDKLKAAKAVKREVAAAYKEAKREGYARPDVQEALKRIDDDFLGELIPGTKRRHGGRLKDARKDCGVFWGSYLGVEQSLSGARKGAPPRFHRFTGEGRLAVQIQGGMSIEELFSCNDQRLRLEPLAPDAWETRTPKTKYTTLWFRVGSTDTREPVWAKIPIYLHRPLPAGSRVKWAYLLARKTATKMRWKAILVLGQVPDLRPVAEGGAIGINFGWRTVDDGLRVAYWIGSDGREGEVVISHRELGRWQKADDLRSIRDKRLEVLKSEIMQWRQDGVVTLPDWFTEATLHVHQWRSQARAAGLVLRWRENRFTGDEQMFATAEAWRKKDKHLYEWQANQLRKACAWRDDFYRTTAARLAQQYRSVCIGDTDWSKLARLPVVEVEETLPAAARGYRMIASPGRFSTVCKERFAATVVRDARLTTQTCPDCWKLDPFDAKVELVRTCRHCHTTRDQDQRNALNLLKGSTEEPAAKPEPSREAS